MSTINRRGFLAAIAGALTLDPERALWVSGAKLISIPKASSFKVYTLLHYGLECKISWKMVDDDQLSIRRAP